MTSLLQSMIFRLKVVQVILSICSIVTLFFVTDITISNITSEFVYLTLYCYVGIGIIVLTSICITEPVSDRVTLYSSCLAVILHLIAAVLIIIDLFAENVNLRGVKLTTALCALGNTVAFGWEVAYGLQFIR